jgi:hypothetical protein
MPWAVSAETFGVTACPAADDAALVFEHGLRSVTMAQLAERTGIGRATTHLAQVTEARDMAGDPGRRLAVVLRTYARIAHQTRHRHDTEIGRFLHRDEHLADAQRQLHDLITSLIAEAATAGGLRDDSPPAELAAYCLHALNAAAGLPSDAAVDRLVGSTLPACAPPTRTDAAEEPAAAPTELRASRRGAPHVRRPTYHGTIGLPVRAGNTSGWAASPRGPHAPSTGH